MADEKQIKDIIEVLTELGEETTIPRNVKDRVDNTVKFLKEKTELKIRVNKALHELDEIADDPNLQAYTRTQIWNVVSLLEKVS